MGCIAIAVPMPSLLAWSVNVKMVLSPHFSVGYQWWVNKVFWLTSLKSPINGSQIVSQANKECTMEQPNKMLAMNLLLVYIKYVENSIVFNDHLGFIIDVSLLNWIIKNISGFVNTKFPVCNLCISFVKETL